MNHRTTASLLAAAALAATLTACGGGDSSKTSATPAATTSPVPTVAPRDRFLQEINAANIESWAHAGPTDDEIAAFPQRWCDQLAVGHSLSVILGVRSGLYPSGSNWGTKIGDTYQVVILGVTAYCPKYRAQVVREAQASGNY